MKLIISTIGTSLLINGASSSDRDLLNNYSNHLKEKIPDSDLQKIDELISIAKVKLKATNLSEIQKYSAELNGIISYYDNQFKANKNDMHLLITTDTYEGEETAKLVKEYLELQELNCQITKIDGMNTADNVSFEAGIKKLIANLYDTVPGYRQQKYHVVFNLTGGFKVIQAYMNTLGMFLADEIVYKFLNGKMILVPKMPIKLDNRELMKKFSSYFAMLNINGTLEESKIEADFFEEVSPVY